jgi:Bacteriophage Sf6, terminase small subunit-like
MATQMNRPPKARKPSADELLHDEIQKQAQTRYAASASIDAAVALSQAKRLKPAPSKTALKVKGRVQLADIRDELLVRVAEGESVFTVCQDDHMPARSSLYKWMREDTQFLQEYEAALRQRADKYVEMIAELSAHMQQRAAMGASNEEVTALKAHINSLQWIAARLDPKKYGDKQQLDIDQKITMDEKQLDIRLAALIAKAKAAKPKAEA